MKGTRRLLFVTWTVTCLAFLVGAVVMRAHLLDDTFIHLRYVENLFLRGELAYNPGEPSFGTSALTYVLLLGKFAAWLPREALPPLAKWLSVVCHAATLGLLAWQARRLFREGSSLGALALSAFALAVALPPSGRWLEDGMETSLALLLSIAAPLAAISFARSDSKKPWMGVAYGLLAAAPGCLRIDLLPISMAAIGLALFPRKNPHPPIDGISPGAPLPLERGAWIEPALGTPLPSGRGVPIESASTVGVRSKRLSLVPKGLALGPLLAWLSALLITTTLLYLQTGHIVSDSAVAKQTGHLEPLFTYSFLRSMMTASPVWLFGAVGLSWRLRKPNVDAALGLLPIGAVLFAGTAVGQFIHGARYFLPALGFAWIVLADLLPKRDVTLRFERPLVTAMLGISILHAAVIAKPIWRATRPAELHLQALPEMTETTLFAAHDIGRLGWYSQARVLDLAGLVNGRAFVQPGLQDGRKCHAIESLGIPEMLVLSETQAEPLRKGDVIDIHCPGFELRYRRLERPVMKAWNVGSPLTWFGWTRVPDAEWESVGALR